MMPVAHLATLENKKGVREQATTFSTKIAVTLECPEAGRSELTGPMDINGRPSWLAPKFAAATEKSADSTNHIQGLVVANASEPGLESTVLRKVARSLDASVRYTTTPVQGSLVSAKQTPNGKPWNSVEA